MAYSGPFSDVTNHVTCLATTGAAENKCRCSVVLIVFRSRCWSFIFVRWLVIMWSSFLVMQEHAIKLNCLSPAWKSARIDWRPMFGRTIRLWVAIARVWRPLQLLGGQTWWVICSWGFSDAVISFLSIVRAVASEIIRSMTGFRVDLLQVSVVKRWRTTRVCKPIILQIGIRWACSSRNLVLQSLQTQKEANCINCMEE